MKLRYIAFICLFLFACGDRRGDGNAISQNQSSGDPAKIIAVGEVAPDFELKGTTVSLIPEKKYFSLKDGIEKGPVLLAFYPMAFTGG